MNLLDYKRWFKQPTAVLHEKVGNEIPFIVRPLSRVISGGDWYIRNTEKYVTIPYYLMTPEAARGISRVAVDAKSAVLAAHAAKDSITFYDPSFVSLSKRINDVAEVLDFACVPNVMGFAPAIMAVTNGQEVIQVTKDKSGLFVIQAHQTGEKKFLNGWIAIEPHCNCSSAFCHGTEPHKPSYKIKVEWDAAFDAIDVWCRRHNEPIGYKGPTPTIDFG